MDAGPESLINVVLRFFSGAYCFVVSVDSSHFFRLAVLADFVSGDPLARFCSNFGHRVRIEFGLGKVFKKTQILKH